MKATPVTWNFVRYRLTDPVSGVDNWRAGAFGLLVAERYYPDLLVWSRERCRGEHGFFRHHLNVVWSVLKDPAQREPGLVTERDLEKISHAIPDSRRQGPAEERAAAAGTICLHLVRFLQSNDRDDIAHLAAAACASVYRDQHADPFEGQVAWASSIPFDEVGSYETAVGEAPEVQSELRLQDADLAFVETLEGPLENQFDAVLRRAFGDQLVPRD
ncbi:MAG: DUF416 family protein [Methyloligellaceae bacterium]